MIVNFKNTKHKDIEDIYNFIIEDLEKIKDLIIFVTMKDDSPFQLYYTEINYLNMIGCFEIMKQILIDRMKMN